MSSWGGWASSLAKTVTEKIDDEITKIATADTTPKLTGEGDDSDLGISTVWFLYVNFTLKVVHSGPTSVKRSPQQCACQFQQFPSPRITDDIFMWPSTQKANARIQLPLPIFVHCCCSA